MPKLDDRRRGGDRDDRLASKWDTRGAYAEDADWTQQLPRCERTERDLFKSGQNSGINFEKYDDIPAESTGEDPPDAVDKFDECDLGTFCVFCEDLQSKVFKLLCRNR